MTLGKLLPDVIPWTDSLPACLCAVQLCLGLLFFFMFSSSSAAGEAHSALRPCWSSQPLHCKSILYPQEVIIFHIALASVSHCHLQALGTLPLKQATALTVACAVFLKSLFPSFCWLAFFSVEELCLLPCFFAYSFLYEVYERILFYSTAYNSVLSSNFASVVPNEETPLGWLLFAELFSTVKTLRLAFPVD